MFAAIRDMFVYNISDSTFINEFYLWRIILSYTQEYYQISSYTATAFIGISQCYWSNQPQIYHLLILSIQQLNCLQESKVGLQWEFGASQLFFAWWGNYPGPSCHVSDSGIFCSLGLFLIEECAQWKLKWNHIGVNRYVFVKNLYKRVFFPSKDP